MGMIKKCSTCDYCVLVDDGYSNYTVMGTTAHCSLGLNPNGSFDLWYGKDKRDTYAEECEKYRSTVGPVEIDVDRECIPYDVRIPEMTTEQWDNYFGNGVVNPEFIEEVALF